METRNGDAQAQRSAGSRDLASGFESSHSVQFYDSDGFLLDTVARLAGDSLERGDASLIIATRAHRDGIEERLAERGLKLAALADQGLYLAIDASETLAKFTVDEWPDALRFEQVVGDVIDRGARQSRNSRAQAFGEMVALLWADGKKEAAIRLEQLWNELGRRHRFSLCCSYPLDSFSNPDDTGLFLKVCGEHSRVIPAESYIALGSVDERMRSISQLQVKAKTLESETAGRKQAETELAEADRRKNEFLAMIGHELRNPLSAVLNAIIASRLDDSRRERALDIAHRQTNQLVRLVDDLLDVARITQGKISLHKEPVQLGTIVMDAVEEARPLAAARGHKLETLISVEAEHLQIEADPARMCQIIGNLIHNAVKFTEQHGRIEVVARRENSEAVIEVRDSGAGMLPEMLTRIFDLFAQGERPIDRAHGGLGVGLTVVKRLVEMHRGSIRASSDGLGKGSEFQIRLPVLISAVKQDAAREIVPTPKTRAHVLIVEDNRDAAESLKMLVELLGHEVDVVFDGLAAVDAVRSGNFDLALVDIGLPGIDGYEAARRIRQLPHGNGIVLAALTGYGQEQDSKHALTVGFDQHLVKPIKSKHLQSLLAEASGGPTAMNRRSSFGEKPSMRLIRSRVGDRRSDRSL